MIKNETTILARFALRGSDAKNCLLFCCWCSDEFVRSVLSPLSMNILLDCNRRANPYADFLTQQSFLKWSSKVQWWQTQKLAFGKNTRFLVESFLFSLMVLHCNEKSHNSCAEFEHLHWTSSVRVSCARATSSPFYPCRGELCNWYFFGLELKISLDCNRNDQDNRPILNDIRANSVLLNAKEWKTQTARRIPWVTAW